MSAVPKEGPASDDENGTKGLANLSNDYQQRPGEQLVFEFCKEIGPPHSFCGTKCGRGGK
jgi:hypothetical protein